MEGQQEGIYYNGIRDQQIDPKTGDLYPWWVPTDIDGNSGSIEFDPDLFDPSYEYKPRGKIFKIPTNREQVFEDPFDLENLRFIDPADVKKAYDDLIIDAGKNPEKLLTVLVGTGGTISMTKQAGNVLKPILNTKQIMATAGDAANQFVTSTFSLPKLIDSSQMEIDYAADMAIAMSWLFNKFQSEHAELLDKFTGFIVTHGTDTAVQSQTYLSFMLGANCPFNVFYVVAQKTVDDNPSDVGENMKLALDVSEKFGYEGRHRGVHGICAGGEKGGLFNGPTSLKISDRDIKLLQDHNDGGPLVDFSGDVPVVNSKFYRSMRSYSEIATDRVESAWVPLVLRGESVMRELRAREGNSAKTDKIVVQTVLERFIVIETFGSFTVNKKNLDAVVQEARTRGKLVFAVNPFPNGSTEHNYAATRELAEQGVIPLRMLAHAAAAKLLWAHSVFGNDNAKIIKFMTENNFCNEQLYVDDILEKNDIEKRYRRVVQMRSDAVILYKDEALRYIDQRLLPTGRKLLRDTEYVSPPGMTDVRDAHSEYFSKREGIYDMNDDEVRAAIEGISDNIFDFVFAILEKSMEDKVEALGLVSRQASSFRVDVRNRVRNALSTEEKGYGLSIMDMLKKWRPDLEVEESSIKEGGEALVMIAIYSAVRRVLPTLGSQFDVNDIMKNLMSLMESDETNYIKEEIKNMGKSVSDYYRMVSEREELVKKLVSEIPRFGVPKVSGPLEPVN